MEYRVVWIHGIGQTRPGYSQDWDKVYNQYLKFPTFDDFIEVLWADVFSSMNSASNLAMNSVATPLTPELDDRVAGACNSAGTKSSLDRRMVSVDTEGSFWSDRSSTLVDEPGCIHRRICEVSGE